MELIRGISGIRGIVGNTLTNDTVRQHVKAFAKVQGTGDILLARDSRPHGENLINIAAKALADSGCNALNYGIIPTPTAQFVVEKNGLAGGIVLTASHNPAEWNGMKFIDSDGCFLDGEKNSRLFELADGNPSGRSDKGTNKLIQDGSAAHILHTCNLSVIDAAAITRRSFKVVVDAVNGAASYALPAMAAALGCIVHRLHCTPDGKFPRGAEPLPHNLLKLGKTVVNQQADVGFATDPDGDRLAVVDEKGNPLGEEYTLPICADGFFRATSSKAPLATNLSTTMALDKIAEKYGSSVIRSAVGEINVVNKMKEIGADLGGEGNGGVILTESHYGRDSLVGAALFLNRMAQGSETVSEIFNSMPQFVMVKDKIELGLINPESALDQIERHFPEAEKDKTDGLKLIWKNAWLHIRKSNTEPIIRIYAEARNRQEIENLLQAVKKIL